MTLLDWVQVGFLIIVVIVGIGGILHVIKNDAQND